jgi:hypothetical protein
MKDIQKMLGLIVLVEAEIDEISEREPFDVSMSEMIEIIKNTDAIIEQSEMECYIEKFKQIKRMLHVHVQHFIIIEKRSVHYDTQKRKNYAMQHLRFFLSEIYKLIINIEDDELKETRDWMRRIEYHEHAMGTKHD